MGPHGHLKIIIIMVKLLGLDAKHKNFDHEKKQKS